MMEMEGRTRELLDKALRSHTEYERAWWKNDRRGRWVVLEPGPGRLLKGSPRHVREYVDAITEQRGRRFSSLSRARAFAREVGGVVRRWRRHMSRRYMGRSVRAAWRYETNPWARVARHVPSWSCWVSRIEQIDTRCIDHGVGVLRGVLGHPALELIAPREVEAAIEHIRSAARLVERLQRDRLRESRPRRRRRRSR